MSSREQIILKRCGMALLLASATFIVPHPAAAQGNTGVTAASDSVYARAKRLVTSGNGAAGRVLVDSMVAAAPSDSPAYAEALYWRAALASSTADAEKDYRRLVADYWFSPRDGDALLQLAQIESARGDRASASGHLQRFMLEAPSHPERGRAGLTLVQLLFAQNDLPHACTAWRQTMNAVPASSIELRNQLSYYSARCTANDVSAGSRVPVVYPPTAPRDTSSTPRDSAVTSAKGRFTLQVAAFATKTEANRLVGRLLTRGLTARIVGTSKPFRVRIGRYETRAAATAAQRQLKAKKLDAMVTEIGPDDK